MGSPASLRYRFGRFELQPSERRLLDEGRAVDVGPRAFDVLLALVELAPRLATKQALLDRVWPGLVVEEGNLHVQVSTLRKIVGPDVIETVAGTGYRFAVSVTKVAGRAAASRLPREASAFFGRDDDLARAVDLVERSRLVTISGGGGFGKTRFALELAYRIEDRFADGARLVELAKTTHGEHVTAAFATALGATEERGRSLRDAVIAQARDRQLLLVVDNCEHVIAECASLVKALLAKSARPKVLTTSREPLRIAGEAVKVLAPLPVPQRDASAEELPHYPSTRMFVARAQAAGMSPAVVAENAATICAICRRLDGIPLAIELAAARTGSIPLGAIARRLDDRFKLLAAGARDADPRHQTLRACIEWSFDLLGEAERDALVRLSVFAGGFSLEAAEDALDDGDAIERIASLVDKSFVVPDPDRNRYFMLETIRAFAGDELARRGLDASARKAHATHFVRLASDAEPGLLGPQQGAWHDMLMQERDNILAAHAWCRDPAHAREALRLVSALRMHWQIRGPLIVGYDLAREALSVPAEAVEPGERASALFAAAVHAYFLGRIADCAELAGACLALTREANDVVRLSDVLVVVGVISLAKGDLGDARAHASEALALARSAKDPIRTLQALNFMGEVDAAAGDLEAADRNYRESFAIAREAGELSSAAGALINSARIALQRNAIAPAARGLIDAAALMKSSGTRHHLVLWLAIAGGLAVDGGNAARGAQLFAASAALSASDGYRLEALDEAYVGERMSRARAALGDAEYARVQSAAAAASDEQVVTDTVAWLESVSA